MGVSKGQAFGWELIMTFVLGAISKSELQSKSLYPVLNALLNMI